MAYLLKWPELLSKQHAVPFMVMICIFVLMTSQREREREREREDTSQPSAKRPKHPYSKEEYAKYEAVLPSVRTVADYKHLQASQLECDASLTILNKKRNDDSTFIMV